MSALLVVGITSCATPTGGARDADVDAEMLHDGATDEDADNEGDSDVPTIGGGDAPEEDIPRARFEPAVDGSLDEWPVLRYRLDTETTALRFGPDQRPPPEDSQLFFDLRWTDQALYFAAQMNDDVAFDDSPMVWQDDSVELYVDGDNNDAVPTYDENDHQLTVTRDQRFADHGTIIDPANQGIRVAVGRQDASFTIELTLPWSLLGEVMPAPGRMLGIDVAFNDDDDGDEEDTHLVMWLSHDITELGSSVQDTSLFRDLILAE